MSSTSTGGVRSGHHGWKDKVRFHLMGLCVLTPLFSDITIHIDISFFWLLGESPIVVAIPMPSAAKARECRFLRRLSYQLGRRKLRHPSSLTCRRSSSDFLPGRGALWVLPIEGFCVTVGVLTMKKAAEIIGNLTKADIKRIFFKLPSSLSGGRHFPGYSNLSHPISPPPPIPTFSWTTLPAPRPARRGPFLPAAPSFADCHCCIIVPFAGQKSSFVLRVPHPPTFGFSTLSPLTGPKAIDGTAFEERRRVVQLSYPQNSTTFLLSVSF